MRIVVPLSALVLVAILATWAYRVNYATRDALGRLAELDAEIAREHEALAVLRAEWAYLNRPDRLRALLDAYGRELELVPLAPENFGDASQIAFPPGAFAAAHDPKESP